MQMQYLFLFFAVEISRVCLIIGKIWEGKHLVQFTNSVSVD